MPVRKLPRAGTGEPCGAPEAVSGGIADPLGSDEEQAEPIDQPMVDGFVKALLGTDQEAALLGIEQDGKAQGSGQEKEKAGQQAGGKGQDKADQQNGVPDWGSPPTARIQAATARVIAELHAAKQELAQELEANLKQLKAVLQETQRIAKDMEAVLREAKAEPSEQEHTRGGNGVNGKHGNGPQEEWNPPGLKKAGKRKAKANADDDDDQSDDQNQDDEAADQSDQGPPPWEPPQDALQH